jgi:hypothetical protein
MMKLTLTFDEAELLRSQHAAAQRGDILFDEIIMPNSRPLGECTSDYMGQVGDALVELSRTMGIASARSQGDAALIDNRWPVAHAALARYACFRVLEGRNAVCDRCVELDGKIAHYRSLASRFADQALLDGIKELMERAKVEKAALHPERTE